VTNWNNRGVTTDPWQPPEWQVTVDRLHPLPPPPERAWRGQRDVVLAAVTTLVVALSGSVVGLVWSSLAPKLSITGVIAGSEEPFRAQIGADAWFLLLSTVAGLLCAAVALALRGRGPGVVVGLALGGVAAAVVADRVGFLAQRGSTLARLHALGIAPHGDVLGLVDFKVRALGVMAAWPIAALLVHALALAVRHRRGLLP
jgi:hypothetical protein